MSRLPTNLIFADFDGRTFLDIEVDLHRGRRNVLDVRLDGGELVAMLSQQFLQPRFQRA